MANVLSADFSADKHYKHSGFSATIVSSYASPSSIPTGLTWDGTNVLSADTNTDKHYKHSGFSATIVSSYASPSSSPRGITWDGTNVLSADSDTDKHYKHSGFSATIVSSYASPSELPGTIRMFSVQIPPLINIINIAAFQRLLFPAMLRHLVSLRGSPGMRDMLIKPPLLPPPSSASNKPTP